ncbi:uncharacterized protein M421DRAFT_390364 [Didymella exigua CBS 183.55]|uniref:Alcohol dehydrogenase-like N-terminal domain-containing protein n=1 Tax=Didymella exigua CBS 183.55 TaxID=1150837 RepID=A0A6A5RQ62_9PLEO|nr:uncharacterized protein M421DRAFT_390364 [Didymella exigua CBS 183.55]KAF1929460.1 hypothetical protein M421DRAFT_390364 [Didymella exigua CBS 183.55]
MEEVMKGNPRHNAGANPALALATTGPSHSQVPPKQVQTRVTVAGLNPHDQKVRDTGLFIGDNLPAIFVNDVTGVVTIVGPEVSKFKVGDRVFSQSNLDGYSQRILQHEIKASNHAETALIIIGGGSNCGKFGVQLLKLAGIAKIVVVRGSEEELQSYGATYVLDRHGGNGAVLQRIRNVVGDDLIYAFDTINLPVEQYLAISALSCNEKGRLARLRFSGGALDESRIIGNKRARPFWDRVEYCSEDGSFLPLRYEAIDRLDADMINELLNRCRDGRKVVQTQFRVSA